VVHRKVNLDGILITNTGTIKLGDFEAALIQQNVIGDLKSDSKEQILAPEIISGKTYTQKTDIWAFGILLYKIVTGDLELASFKREKNSPEALPEDSSKHWTEAFKDFIKKCLNKQPDLRPKAADLLNHEFVAQVDDNSNILKELAISLINHK